MDIANVRLQVTPLVALLGTMGTLEARLLATVEALVSVQPLLPQVGLSAVLTRVERPVVT